MSVGAELPRDRFRKEKTGQSEETKVRKEGRGFQGSIEGREGS